jgi:hypothetical protein
VALRIANSFHWHNQQHSVHFSLAQLFSHQGRFDDAHTHVEHAKSYAFNDPYSLGRAMELHAHIWDIQGRLEEAKPEALCAVGVFEGLGAMKDLERCRKRLWDIEKRMENPITSDEVDLSGELPETVLLPAPINPPSSLGEPSGSTNDCRVDPPQAELIAFTITSLIIFILPHFLSSQGHQLS